MSTTPDTSAIEIEHLTRRFGRLTVVDDLTLRIPAGSLVGFIGLNGAGKSTTIRMLVGLLAPTSGSIHVAGIDVRDRAQRVELCRRIGYVPDRPTVYGWMTVQRAIDYTSRFYPTWDGVLCKQLEQRFKLPRDRRVDKLSKGQAAKLQLLLAVSHRPQVLILDEPTSGFDPIVREEFLENVLRVSGEQGQTVLFSSHALPDVQRLADRIAILHEGKLALEGSTDEIVSRIKRVRMVLDDDEPQTTPADVRSDSAQVLRSVRYGREWTLTLNAITPETINELRTRHRATSLTVDDLTLDDIFKDLVRGKEEAAS